MNMSASKNKKYTVLCFGLLLAVSASALADPSPQRQQEIMHLLRQDCGACHGMTLNGGLGPALKSPGLDRLSVDAVKATILNGRPGTPMPPWKPFLTDDEAGWLAQQLKRGLGQ